MTEPADDTVLTSFSFTVSGLTIDTHGVANDTIVLTLGISPVGAGPITWENDGADHLFGYDDDIARGGEGYTFNAITVSGTSSGG